MSSNSVVKTSFGETIQVVDKFRDMYTYYYNPNFDYNTKMNETIENTGYKSLKEKFMKWVIDCNVVGRTYHSFSLLTNFMQKKASLDLKFKRHLDIGAGPGLHSIFFMGLGIAETSHSIDIRQGRAILKNSMKEHLQEVQKLHNDKEANAESLHNMLVTNSKNAGFKLLFPHLSKAINECENGVTSPYDKTFEKQLLSDIIKHKQYLLPGFLRHIYNGSMYLLDYYQRDIIGVREDMLYSNDLDSLEYTFDFDEEKIHNEDSYYIVDDIYKSEEKYDLITSFLNLEYFKSDEIFKKVNSMLPSGGIFCFIVNCWWYPVNGTMISGDFPYSCQRLSKPDFIKYVKEFYPDTCDAIMRVYNYNDPFHPTITSYIEEGDKNNFEFLASDRVSPRVPFSPWLAFRKLSSSMLSRFENHNYDEVLNNIHKFRQDVTIEDLQTSHISLCFRKK